LTSELQLQEELKIRKDLPRHIAIIMDGNGRWAKKRGLPRIAGHREGIKSVHDIVEACGEVGIKILTLYTFSKENWKRPPMEVSFLMKLLIQTIKKEIRDLMKNDVKIVTMGHIEDLPEKTREAISWATDETKNNKGLILNLALSYGSRNEILDATKSIAKDVKSGKINIKDINEKIFANHLYTSGFPDPDLVIRTSGEMRISNFLLWQIAYSELYITNTLWPDFRRKHLYEAIISYLNRERRFGMVSEQIKFQSAK
jgi:undecaprenyl diphosphate synthase